MFSYIMSPCFFFPGEGIWPEVSGVDQGATARSSEPIGPFPAEACRKGALCGHPRTGDPLRRPQIRASQQQDRAAVGAG